MSTPDLAAIEAAAEVVHAYLPPTPSWSYPLLDAELGASVVVKHENAQPTGAFKVRGGVNLFAGMSGPDRARGVITSSTGNHAQSIAYGAKQFGSTAVIVMPTTAPADKIAATEALGAEVVLHGPTMTESGAHAAKLAADSGRRLISPGNEPEIIAGHATLHLELLRRHRDLEVLFVPIGSGTSAAGACLVAEQLAPGCAVIGVQSSAAPAAHRAWTTGAPATAECHTRASGLATGASYALPQSILAGRLHDFVLVDDDEIDSAARLLATLAHTLSEGAGAAALAAAIKVGLAKDTRAGIVLSGGNASVDELALLTQDRH